MKNFFETNEKITLATKRKSCYIKLVRPESDVTRQVETDVAELKCPANPSLVWSSTI